MAVSKTTWGRRPSGGGGGGSNAPIVNPVATTSSSGGGGVSPVKTKVQQASGVIAHPLGFWQVAASVSAVQGWRAITGATQVLAQVGYVMPYSGSILALTYVADAAKTAGQATFIPYIAGSAQVGTAVWTVNNSSGSATWPAGTYVFDAGDVVDVRITTDSAFAGTPSVAVLLYVTFDAAIV